MKTANLIFGILLSATFVFSGCSNDNLADINDLKQRVNALEAWQQTVNDNIGSLQQLVAAMGNNDYVTSVTAFETPAPGGYRITFLKSTEVTIWNGAKGDPVQVPVMGVALGDDDEYYWTLDGEFMTDAAGNRIPATGSPPKVAIGSDGVWYISEDGTAEGTPPAAGWVSTGVRATGDMGPQGPQGDAIFAPNGVDNTNNDYVVFTLADGSLISLPRYRATGISFTQPGILPAGESRQITYASVGTIAPTVIRVVDLPAEWSYSVDYAARRITLSTPVTFHGDNFTSEATVLVGIDNQISAMYPLKVTGDFTGPARNILGALYYQNGVAKGLVYVPNNGTAGSGRAMSLDQTRAAWVTGAGSMVTTGATDTDNGRNNMAKVYNMAIGTTSPANSFEGLPAFKWADDKNPSGTVYNSNAVNVWFFPAVNDYKTLYNVWSENKTKFEIWLTAAGGSSTIELSYSSSTEGSSMPMFNYYLSFSSGISSEGDKNIANPILAVLAF